MNTAQNNNVFPRFAHNHRPSVAHQMWDSFVASIRQGHDMQRLLNQYR